MMLFFELRNLRSFFIWDDDLLRLIDQDINF